MDEKINALTEKIKVYDKILKELETHKTDGGSLAAMQQNKARARRLAYVGAFLFALGGSADPVLLKALYQVKTKAEYDCIMNAIDEKFGDDEVVKQMMKDCFAFARYINPQVAFYKPGFREKPYNAEKLRLYMLDDVNSGGLCDLIKNKQVLFAKNGKDIRDMKHQLDVDLQEILKDDKNNGNAQAA